MKQICFLLEGRDFLALTVFVPFDRLYALQFDCFEKRYILLSSDFFFKSEHDIYIQYNSNKLNPFNGQCLIDSEFLNVVLFGPDCSSMILS